MAVIYAPAGRVTNANGTLKAASVNLPVPEASPRASRDITYRAPRLHNEPRVDPSCQSLPLSHRARKQVYMSSSLFDEGGPKGEAIYTPSRQTAVYGDLKPVLDQIREIPDFQLPAPRDFRATVNAGHGVVSPYTQGAFRSVDVNGDVDVVSFGGGPDIPIVRAVRDEETMPREFWATSSQLTWTDTRAETCGARRQQECRKPPANGAESRKLRELSSEVFGSVRRMEKSTSSPSHDIWSQSFKYFDAIDSTLGPRSATPDPQPTKVPLSARDRRSKNLSTSSENLFTKYPALRQEKKAASVSPAPSRARMIRGSKDEDNTFQERRRAERNYSDLFGNQSGTPNTGQRRQELTGTSNISLFNDKVEIATRNVNSWRDIAPKTPREASQSEVLPGPKQESTPRDPKEKAVTKAERACWDTTTIMSSGAEIARRTRELAGRDRSNSAGRRDIAAAMQEKRPPSAAERKRMDLSSGQFRSSNDLEGKAWDDGRKGPGPVMDLAPTPITVNNISNAPWRNVPNDSAKQRRIMSLMSSVTFH